MSSARAFSPLSHQTQHLDSSYDASRHCHITTASAKTGLLSVLQTNSNSFILPIFKIIIAYIHFCISPSIPEEMWLLRRCSTCLFFWLVSQYLNSAMFAHRYVWYHFLDIWLSVCPLNNSWSFGDLRVQFTMTHLNHWENEHTTYSREGLFPYKLPVPEISNFHIKSCCISSMVLDFCVACFLMFCHLVQLTCKKLPMPKKYG